MASGRSDQDDVDTRQLTPAQRERRKRTYGIFAALVACAVCGLVGYTLGRRHRPRSKKTVVQSELDKRPTTTIPSPPEPPPVSEPPLARLVGAAALHEKTRVDVRFATAVDLEQAADPKHYAIEPEVEITKAAIAADGQTVTLTTSPLEHDTDYRLTIQGIEMPPPTPKDAEATFRYLDTRRSVNGLIALYDFEEAEGEIVHDVSRVGEPLDLKIREPGDTQWIPGGIAIQQDTLLAGDGTATKLITAWRASNALTLEAWLAPANTTQAGPARIITLSRGGAVRNFTLGQQGGAYYIRLRSSKRDANGEPPVVSKGGVATALTHVVYTRDADGKVELWINGQLNAEATVPGDFSNWLDFPFGLANEFDTARTWLGELHLVALYARALTAEEIARNWKAGPEGKTVRPQ